MRICVVLLKVHWLNDLSRFLEFSIVIRQLNYIRNINQSSMFIMGLFISDTQFLILQNPILKIVEQSYRQKCKPCLQSELYLFELCRLWIEGLQRAQSVCWVVLIDFRFRYYQQQMSSFNIKIIMIERQNYKQFIKQQGQLETNIAEGWGYNVNPKEFVYRPVKVQQQAKVAMIEPMKRIIDVPISKKLEIIESELLMMENQKKLNKIRSQAKKVVEYEPQGDNGECAAIKMMHQRVQEYNFLVDHRHIIQKNSQRARKILGIKKTKVQILNQEVKALKDKIPNSSFAEMIQINKKIAHLYRSYEKTMYEQKKSEVNQSLSHASPKRSSTKRSITTFNSLVNSSKLQPQVKTQNNSRKGSLGNSLSVNRKQKSRSISIRDLVIMQELKESSDGDSIFAQSQIIEEESPTHPQSLFLNYERLKFQKKTSENIPRARLHTVMQKKSIEQVRKQKLNTKIAESFIDKQMLQKGKVLDRRLRENEDVIEVWRQRIDENKEKNKAAFQRIKPKVKRFKKALANTNKGALPAQNTEELQKVKRTRQILADRMQQVREQLEEKQKMFAAILGKKQSKFKRVPGTHIMQQTDANQTAKKILGMNKTNREHLYHSAQKVVRRRKSTNESDEPEWLLVQDDQRLYQSMCKNEKLNILLKRNKK